MGAWGVNTFENDAAVDWTYRLESAEDLSPVLLAITGVVGVGDEYLDADQASEGLAACEVVARLRGEWGQRDAYTETIDRWVEAHPEEPNDVLVAGALAAIDRVLSPPCELLDLWEEGDAGAWRESVADLRRRVAG